LNPQLKAVRRTIDHKAQDRTGQDRTGQDRNDIVHRHSYADRDLRKLEAMYMHTAGAWSNARRFSYHQMQQIRSQHLKKVVDEKKAEFCSINKALLMR
jgi:ferric iron reductase protein FhuF